MTKLVLSLFPGADLLGMAFELEGFCVVQGPDVQFGRDVREFHPPAGRFDGIIGGPPCQAFSQLRTQHPGRTPAWDGIPEFQRVVAEARPDWFVMENVRQAPPPCVLGYTTNAALFQNRWLGEEQSRLRRFTLGIRGTEPPASLYSELTHEFVVFENIKKAGCFTANGSQWEPGVDNGNRKGRSRSVRTDAEFRRGCRLQGLPETFLDGAPFTVEGKIRLIGNGVPIPMGRAVARAVKRCLGLETEVARAV
jgi:DNA (cytosine-5)-methyltransferase 1